MQTGIYNGERKTIAKKEHIISITLFTTRL